MITDKQRLTYVLENLNRGWNVFPLGKASKRPNREALLSTGHKKVEDGKIKASWELFQYERVTEELIDRWWSHSPQSNYGIITGNLAKLVVIDIDPRNGGDKSMKELHLPPTYIVNTGGGGWHYYYTWPWKQKVPNLDYLPGIEIKGQGGYVVGPGSIHDKTKKEYEAANSIEEITKAPEWLLELGTDSSKEKLWKVGANGAKIGTRNDTAASVAGKILSSLPVELWDSVGWGGFIEWNKSNEKPLPESELQTVFNSIAKKAEQQIDDDKGGKDSVARRIVELITEDEPTLFHDDVHKTYIRVKASEHEETHPIYSKRFKDWVVKKYWEVEGRPPRKEQISQALDVMHSKALFEGKLCQLSIRVAGEGDNFWYDLGDKHWRAVKVSKKGWSIIDKPPTVFKRFSHQLPQIEPSQSGSLGSVLDFVNIQNEGQALLLQVYIVSCFIPSIPHPIPVLHGSQGAAKSTFMRVIRRLVDPSKTELLSIPTRIDQLVQQLSHHWMPFFDNVTTIPHWTSDALCRAVTGEGFTKRELFTDDEDVIYAFKCCIGINGICLAAQKPDLLDRSILFELERIPDDKRTDEKTFWRKFDEMRPIILGGILSTLSQAMAIKENVKQDRLPRMADFALWGCAIAEAMGYKQSDFIEAYQVNLDEQNEEAIKEHPVAVAIRSFMSDRDKWEGKSSELLTELEAICDTEKFDTRQRLWPKAANALSRRIREVKTNLAYVGIKITINDQKSRSLSILNCRKTENIVQTVSPTNGHNDKNDISATGYNSDPLDIIKQLDPNPRYVD